MVSACVLCGERADERCGAYRVATLMLGDFVVGLLAACVVLASRDFN